MIHALVLTALPMTGWARRFSVPAGLPAYRKQLRNTSQVLRLRAPLRRTALWLIWGVTGNTHFQSTKLRASSPYPRAPHPPVIPRANRLDNRSAPP